MAANWTRANEIAWQDLGDSTVLVHTRTGARWTLNAAASAIWRLCDGRALSAVRGEIADFCQLCSAHGLLRPATAGATPASMASLSMFSAPPQLKALGLTAGSRRRPSPRGNSGPG
jgi:hypothetical protein